MSSGFVDVSGLDGLDVGLVTLHQSDYRTVLSVRHPGVVGMGGDGSSGGG